MRGVSMTDQVNMATLAIEAKRARTQENEAKLYALSLRHQAITNELDRLEKKALMRFPEYDERNMHLIKYDKNAEMEELQEEVTKVTKDITAVKHDDSDAHVLSMIKSFSNNTPSSAVKKKDGTSTSVVTLRRKNGGADDDCDTASEASTPNKGHAPSMSRLLERALRSTSLSRISIIKELSMENNSVSD